ncbi:hypothetical protein JCM8202v2_001583 [Rhodotorula sphaerocarpa]
MAPKRKLRASETIQSDFTAALEALRSPHLLPPDRLPDDLVLRAYGLAGPSKGLGRPAYFNRACPPRWQGDQAPSTTVSPAGGTASTSKTPATEILVLEGDTEPSEDEILLKSASATKKAKGKAKTTAPEEKEKPCSPETCANNPNCLNWLGQEKWEDTRKALKDFRKAAKLPPDPANDRDPDIPGGLVVWFRDLRFRRGVYSCVPAENGNVEQSPMYQLQVLFASLQKSQQAAYDPEPLVQALKIKKTEQQDAQEFSKLFLNLLDREFKKQAKKAEAEGGDASVGKLVEDLFEGQITYGTRCSACGTESERSSPFLELEINLKRACKLEERLAHSLEPETLEGDNQYFCETCDRKQDAERYQKLTSLPPVLHFSILRFVFDLETLERRKSQHAISYPLQIDMGKYVAPDAQGRQRSIWYDLKGVLMHKGTSAHHGHYVAQVYDESRSKWFLFDDETVSPVDDLNSPTTYDEDGAAVTSKKRPAAGFTRAADGSILPKSKDAYMLVYTRREAEEKEVSAEPEPPALAADAVEKLDARYCRECEAYQDRAKEVERAFEAMRSLKRSVYQHWDITRADVSAPAASYLRGKILMRSEKVQQKSYLVDRGELRRWMEEGLKKPSPAASARPTPAPGSDEGTNGISKDEVNAPSLHGDSPAIASPAGEIADLAAAEEHPEPPSSTEGPRNGAQPRDNEVEVADRGGDVNTTSGEAEVEEDLPDPKTIGERLRVDAPIHLLHSDGVICSHGKADPRRAEQMKRISEDGVMALQQAGVTIDPVLEVPTALCSVCVAGMAADHAYTREHPKRAKEFSEANNDRSGTDFVLVSSAWVKDWRKPLPKMHVTGIFYDPSPNDEPYLSDIRCEHGKGQPDAARRTPISLAAVEILRAALPGWKPLRFDACDVCEGVLEVSQTEAEELRKRQGLDKRNIKSLDADQGRLGATRLPLSGVDDAHYIVPREWARKWIAWSRKKDFSPTDRPMALRNQVFLCKHGELCLDLVREAESARTINIVQPKEWKYLEKNYDAGPPINVWQEPGLTAPSSSPPICGSCLSEHKKQFETAELRIRILTDSDLDEHGERKIGQRASSRIKQKPAMAWQRQLRRVEMSKEDKVMDLKRKIEEEAKIPIIAQRLFYNFAELREASARVVDLGLMAGDTVEVYNVQINEDDLAKLDDAPRRGRRKRSREEGFGGTGLLGLAESQEGDPQVNGGSGPSVEEALDVEPGPSKPVKRGKVETSTEENVASENDVDMASETGIPCPQCTFLNHADLAVCEICEHELQA